MSEDSARPTQRRPSTIRSQILLGFLAMSVITASLGFFSVRDLEREGKLVDRTFDRSLMSINFARAAAADFNSLQAAVARRALAGDKAMQARLDTSIAEIQTTMLEDLSVAVDRAQSDRAVKMVRKVQDAVAVWTGIRQQIEAGGEASSAWAALDRQATLVNQHLEHLIDYTAGDGFINRQDAHATIESDKRFNLAATVLAIFLSGTITWLLSRRVLHPIRQASAIAGKIADGDLGVVVPEGKSDELGALLAAMESMRRKIKLSMEREVELRQSAQMRLADALDGSCEGIVVVDSAERIALANAQASRLLETVCAPLAAGDPAARFVSHLARPDYDQTFDLSSNWEVAIAGGLWLRVSRSDTHEGGSVYVFSDITLFKSQQTELRNANFWLDAALDNLSNGLCLFDSSNRLKVFNKRLCDLLSLPPGCVSVGMTAAEFVAMGQGPDPSPEAKRAAEDQLARQIASRVPSDNEIGHVNGRTLAISHRPLAGDCWMATFEDVTERLQAAEKIAYMARHDALTGLPNRAFFAERIESALTSVDRGDGFALFCLDLDHFKEVNDTLGHPIGDELLRTVSARLRAAVSDDDMVARLGGDEFAILQSHVRSAADVRLLAQKIIQNLNVPCEIEGNRVPISVSIGLTLAPADGRTYDKLLKNADMALYRAKADGRNGFRYFELAMDERQQARRVLELDLREALARDQFEVDYQPVYDVAEEQVVGFEALVRWRHPSGRLVPPSDFIPIAEEIGLITQIGDWVLQRACSDAMTWPGDLSVAVNVSAAQLRHAGLHDSVLSALLSSGMAPGRLVLEITETVLIANTQNALHILKRFKAMGIRIALDDFGTGYSSLSYLHSFPFDSVKIDKSFVFEVMHRPEATAIVRAVIALCRSLGVRTIAEGVETQDQLTFLKQEGCNEAQGFFMSPPITVGSVNPLLLRHGIRAARVPEPSPRSRSKSRTRRQIA